MPFGHEYGEIPEDGLFLPGAIPQDASHGWERLRILRAPLAVPRPLGRKDAPLVAHFGEATRNLQEPVLVQDGRSFLEEGGVHEAETGAAGADLFLHPYDLGEVQEGLAVTEFCRPCFHLPREVSDPPDADVRQGRPQHDMANIPDGLGRGGGPIQVIGQAG